MPLSNVIILIGIVAAFMAFGLSLAWAQYRTGHLSLQGTDVKPQTSSTNDGTKLAA